MRKRRNKKTFAKLGLLFVIILFLLASISISYSAWTDTIMIHGTITTWDGFASISDFVWNDLDVDGIQDDGEPGIPDVTANLYLSDDTFVDFTITDINGYYIFDDLIPGDYYLGFILPDGYVFSPQDIGGDAVDSDVDVNTGQTTVTTLELDENNITWDAGMIEAGDGCSHGFWKTHTNEWIGYTPGQTLDTVFVFPLELSELEQYTIIEALEYDGTGSDLIGKAKILLVQSIAALLNAAHPSVDYLISETGVISQVNTALASINETTMINLKDALDSYNNLGGCLCE